ncbi:MAG: FkbM family methyltransferase [Bacteroidota bacterium]|nr:FkbM family methyltransferase [Bacteroidota bacterium]
MNDLGAKLAEIERLAHGSRWQRLWHTPARYIFALGFRELIYARSHRARPTDVKTFFGLPMRVLLPAGTDLYLLGGKSHESETRLARVMLRYLKPNDNFVDVGGHFGYFSLLASRLVGPQGRVVAFEASRNTFAVLADNVRPQANIAAFNQALSDQPETISFFEFPVLYNEFNSMNVDQFRHEKWFAEYPPVKTEVAATTLDAALAELGVVPAFIKIDVEGAELKVIRGAAQTLAAHRPLLVMEYLAPGRHNTAHHEAAALLASWGYAGYAPTATGELEPCPDLDAYLARRGEDSTNFVFVKA